MSALHSFFLGNFDIEILRELLRKWQGWPDYRDTYERTPLHIAVLKCERYPQQADRILLAVRELINYGSKVNLGDKWGCTPLHAAVMCRNYKMIDILLNADAQINAIDDAFCTPLHYATTQYSLEEDDGSNTIYDTDLRVVKLLLRNNPLVDFQNRRNETPLMFAVKDDNYPIVRELLKRNASVNLQDSSGDSAMHYALNQEEVINEVVLELARHGGSFEVINNFDKNPVVTYLDKLRSNPTRTEVENAIQIIKLFLLSNYQFRAFEEVYIDEIHKLNKDCYLSQDLDACHKEVMKMQRKNLASNWTVYKAVYMLAFRNYGKDNLIPLEVLDKLLNKLLRQKYRMYFDVMAFGISRTYLSQKFAEICCNIQTAIAIFEYDTLNLISKYLRNIEMLCIMLVCFMEKPISGLSRFRRSQKCSIS